MNKEQEELVVHALWLLIEKSDKISDSKKRVWIHDYTKAFPEKDGEENKSREDWEKKF